MKKLSTESKVIVLTVGTGNTENIEESLYTPLMKSIEKGEWNRIILLPSQHTVEYANVIRNRITELSAEIAPIPGEGCENNADASFAHFDGVLGKLIESDGVSPQNITLDFTRGTKAMSAALVLAGVARGIPELRYIEGKRGTRGNVIPGAERIKQIFTDVASASQKINLAERLMLRGDFEAVQAMHEEMSAVLEKLPERLCARLEGYWRVSAIYAAWDRFDYRRACDLFDEHREVVSGAGDFKPTQDMEQWINHLANDPDQDNHEDMAVYLRYLCCDMLANAERRYRDGLFEDAGVRWYRLLELIGQARLFDKGYDSGELPANDSKVVEFNDKLGKKSKALGKGKNGTLQASRYQVAKFLKHLGDDFGKRLLKENQQAYVKNRNNGLLAHGFYAESDQMGKEDVRSIIKKFENLLYEDRHESHEWLMVARSLDFSHSRGG